MSAKAAAKPAARSKPAASAPPPAAPQVQPYLFFNGRCDEAIAFYGSALDARVAGLFRFKDSPDQSMVKPGWGEKVMHAELRIAGATVLVSDGGDEGPPRFDGFSLSLTVPDEAEAERRFNALAESGKVTMPLMKTFFAPRFGMVDDRFGVSWMVHVTPPPASGVT